MMSVSGNLRRFSLLLTAGLLGIALLLGGVRARPEMSGDAADQMRRAAAFYDSVTAVTRGASSAADVDPMTAIALGYLERLRLGLGSPFRLVDFALVDPRLDESTRRRVAWALLARLRRGDAYAVDPIVADGLDGSTVPGGANGAAHVALIEDAIEKAGDARGGELAVRLAYTLAAGEGTIAERADMIATQVAALVTDRVQAQQDLREILHAAGEEHIDPLSEVTRRRQALALAVERPAAQPLDADVQTNALRAVPKLLEAIRALDANAESSHEQSAGGAVSAGAPAPVLGLAAAKRLATIGSRMPPESPVAVTMRSHRALLLAADAGSPVDGVRDDFVSQSLNAETLAAAYARLASSGDTLRREPAVTVLAAATALRAMAQEPPWFPGLPSPTVADLRAEFGLTGVTFDAGVRADWQPYYLRMIGMSIRDMQRVLDGFSVAGLRVSFGVAGLPDTVLALHDPKTRTIKLSVMSSAGTIGHELAHDLDWQAARSLFAGNGYSTDRAMREQRGPLAASMRDLASARVVNRRGAPPPAERPAEVFARNVDWLVAVSLARQGRSDGYLTAVQDAALTGYTTVSPVAMIFGAARPLVDAIQEMTYLPEAVRTGFLEQWGDVRTVDPYLFVRHVLTLPAPRRRYAGAFSRLFDDDALRLTSDESTICAAEEASWAPELRVRQMLLDLALDSRALGIARMRARYYPPAGRPAWVNGILGIAPWAPSQGVEAVRRIRATVAAQLDMDRAADQLRFATPSIFGAGTSSCSLAGR
jgi:hypothetical protein